MLVAMSPRPVDINGADWCRRPPVSTAGWPVDITGTVCPPVSLRLVLLNGYTGWPVDTNWADWFRRPSVVTAMTVLLLDTGCPADIMETDCPSVVSPRLVPLDGYTGQPVDNDEADWFKCPPTVPAKLVLLNKALDDVVAVDLMTTFSLESAWPTLSSHENTEGILTSTTTDKFITQYERLAVWLNW